MLLFWSPAFRAILLSIHSRCALGEVKRDGALLFTIQFPVVIVRWWGLETIVIKQMVWNFLPFHLERKRLPLHSGSITLKSGNVTFDELELRIFGPLKMVNLASLCHLHTSKCSHTKSFSTLWPRVNWNKSKNSTKRGWYSKFLVLLQCSCGPSDFSVCVECSLHRLLKHSCYVLGLQLVGSQIAQAYD